MSKFISKVTLSEWVYNKLIAMGVDDYVAVYLNLLILLLAAAIITYIIAFLSSRIVGAVMTRFARRTSSTFDDHMLNNKVFKYASRFVPLLFVMSVVPIVFSDFENWIKNINRIVDCYLILLSIWVIRAFLYACKDFIKATKAFHDKPVESYVQIMVILTYLFGGVLIFSTITDKSVYAFFTAMGAASAILLLIFKDTILGFVASIQISTNDMVRIGDWITMDKYGADGDVVEISLTTVKVQNFDKTITTIPTYYMISDSFKNWRGMQTSGGRRIKRAIYIKISSIRYLSADDVERFGKIQLIKEYLDSRQDEIEQYNQQHKIDKSLLINGRSLTNIGVFRKYMDAYIGQLSHTHKGHPLMVRQLAPTTTGMPIELYMFTNDVKWVNYEGIMADIFDHFLAAVGYFDLDVFEMPGADDVRRLVGNEGGPYLSNT